MESTGHRIAIMLAAAIFTAQAAASLLVPPTAGDNAYQGTTGDVLNELLFAAGTSVLAVALLLTRASRWARWAASGASLGCALLAIATVATVAAGEERWDAAFVVGFLLAVVGCLAGLVVTRSLGLALLLLGLVLALAFYDRAGALALAVALLVVARLRPPVLQDA